MSKVSLIPAVDSLRVGIRGIAYHFDCTRPIEEIPMLANDPLLLVAFKEAGHERFACSYVSLAEQAVLSARKTLDAAGLAPADIDAVVVGFSELLHFDRYPEMLSTGILTGLGLSDVPVVGVSLAGCANLASAMRVARNMIVAEGMMNVLVVETNQVRGKMERPYVSTYSGAAGVIFADGAASCIVTTENADFSIEGMGISVLPIDKQQVDLSTVCANNVLGYRQAIARALQQAGMVQDDIAHIFTSCVNRAGLDWLMTALELPLPDVFTGNICRTAHVWSADCLIGLADQCAAQAIQPGAAVLLLSQAESYYSAIVCRKHGNSTEEGHREH